MGIVSEYDINNKTVDNKNKETAVSMYVEDEVNTMNDSVTDLENWWVEGYTSTTYTKLEDSIAAATELAE